MASFPRANPLLLLTFALLVGCGGPEAVDTGASPSSDGAPDVPLRARAQAPEAAHAAISDPTYVVPSDGLPDRIFVQDANNNLDVVRHQGRVFFAFRTAPTHFASEDVLMHVVSSEDQVTWELEASISLGTDVREPRFLSWDGRLFLYYAILGTDWWDFEPQGTQVIERLGQGRWTDAQDLFEPGFIPWRTKTVGGVPYMIAYSGGEDIYDPGEANLEVHWLTTDDGYNWRGVDPDNPVVLQGGCSETDFVIQDDGSVISVCRNEAGDADGWGSKVCRATPQDPTHWQCVTDPKKYDSPLMLKSGDDIYLVARRNLTRTGNYDLGLDFLPDGVEDLLYLVYYSTQPKRCAVWEVDPGTLRVEHLLDLPSNGDTCFPGAIASGPGRFEVYNYTSSTELADIPWIVGQVLPTSIYRLELTVP